MTDREQQIFERALNLVANEYGHTREQALKWLHDDPQWKQPLSWPKDAPVGPLPDGTMPFIQVTRTSHITVRPDMWDILSQPPVDPPGSVSP